MSIFRHPLMREGDAIDIIGVNGDSCRIAGPGMENNWGVQLAPHSTGLFDAPFKTNWTKGMLGQVFQSWSPQRRDFVFTVHILNPETGDDLQGNPDLWHTIYSRWKAMWSIEQEATIIYTSVDGERRLYARYLEAAKSFSSQQFEGIDPHILLYGSVMMTVACENPYWQGPTEIFTWEVDNPGSGSFWFPMPFYNPATVIIWPYWALSDLAQWTLPDYSWGWQEYGRGPADLGKTVPLPLLTAGEIIDVNSSPDTQTIVAANGNPVMQRMGGRDLEYPIQPGAGSSTDGCTVRVTQVTNPDGARCELHLPRWYSEPISTPLVV